MPDQRDLAPILLKHGYTGTKKIGEGSFGVALLVEDAEGNKAVCKVVDVSKASAKETQEARREGRLLSQVKHPYIVRYRENFADRGWLGIVMDYCDGGDLTAQIEAAKTKQQSLPEPRVLRWLTQACLALKYLHSKHILHRDLKPSNIFLTKAGDIRMGDFGISKVMSCTAAFARTFVGTPYYLSPEVIQEKPYSWPSDVWSMGCILYQMCALKVPFDATNITGLAQKIIKSPIPQVPSGYSEGVRELQLDMMRRTPDSRPKADDIINREVIQAVVRAMLSEAEGKKEKPKEKEEKARAKYEVLDQFQRFDQNGDGVIDRQELGRVLKHLDANVWTDANVGQIMAVADSNQDGRIQFEEFLAWVFGGSTGKPAISARAEQLIALAHVAATQEDIDELIEHLLGWRQYVDMGCLRVSPPEVAAKACEALAWLSISARSLLEAAPAPKAHDAARQMRAILQAVEQLLSESTRQHVRRAAGATSRTALRGFVLERADGARFGQCPGGLTDSCLDAMGAQWEVLHPGERVLEVRGSGAAASKPAATPAAPPARGRSPEPTPAAARRPAGAPNSGRAGTPEGVRDDAIAASVVLCTSHGRQLEFGSKLSGSQGAPFGFKAPEGEEIEEVLFSGRTCVGVKTAPIVVSWPQDKVQGVRAAFQSAIQSFWPVLLVVCHKMGARYSNYALLEGRRLGLTDLVAPADAPSLGRQPAPVKPPAHWDLGPMGGLNPAGIPYDDTAQVPLGKAEVARLQQLLQLSFKAEPAGEALRPSGLELVLATRIQSWRAWSGYATRLESIREELRVQKEEGRSGLNLADPMSAAHLEPLGVTLDQEANCRWLFHGITVEAAEKVDDASFNIDTAGAEDGMLYGRGIYLTEWCSQVDRSVNEQPGGLRFMLLCRATLGNVLRDEAILPDKVQIVGRCTGGDYHSVLGDREERCPGSTRDFVVYDREQVYPEFLLAYRRVYK